MHNGIKYRSLLEAKWAAFFTRIGWQFEYEPFEGNGYIPDFVIYGERPLAVEVKPAVSWYDLSHHTAKVSSGLENVWASDILVVGASPVALRSNGDLCVGIIGEPVTETVATVQNADGELHYETQQRLDFDWALWSACPKCNAATVLHESQSWERRPCSHYDGHQWTVSKSQESALKAHWKRACNEVQWRGAA